MDHLKEYLLEFRNKGVFTDFHLGIQGRNTEVRLHKIIGLACSELIVEHLSKDSNLARLILPKEIKVSALYRCVRCFYTGEVEVSDDDALSDMHYTFSILRARKCFFDKIIEKSSGKLKEDYFEKPEDYVMVPEDE